MLCALHHSLTKANFEAQGTQCNHSKTYFIYFVEINDVFLKSQAYSISILFSILNILNLNRLKVVLVLVSS